MGEMVKLHASDGNELNGYLAKPAGEPRGSIVVVQEIFGVNEHIRSIADRFAAEGYVAIAPALFDRMEKNVDLKYEGDDQKKAYALMQQLTLAEAQKDVAAGFAAVKGTGRTAVVGFCYGGLMSWLAATRGDKEGMTPVCCVAYYPGGIGSVAEEKPACPVLVHFGLEDTHIGPEQREALKKANHAEVRIEEWAGAQHGFNCDMRSAYNPEVAKQAWAETLGFLAKYVG